MERYQKEVLLEEHGDRKVQVRVAVVLLCFLVVRALCGADMRKFMRASYLGLLILRHFMKHCVLYK